MAETYNNLYLDTRRALKANGVEAASLEAMELVAGAAGVRRSQLQRDLQLYAGSQVERRLAEMIGRRLTGEPLPYVIGEWEFYGLTLEITPDVLIPRPDTETLAEAAIRLAREAGPGARVLDLCAGSGCIGLAVAAHAPQCRVVLADLSEPALQICRRNIRRCQLASRVTFLAADARQAPSAFLGNFDLIACNPPYIPSGEIPELDASVRDYEPLMALDGGDDGLDFYRDITAKWRRALKPGGALLFEVGMGQAQDVADLLRSPEDEDITILPDARDIDRVVLAKVKP